MSSIVHTLQTETADETLRLPNGSARKTTAPAVLSWRDLKVITKQGKVVLRGAGQINGGFWAIMGPSGSGKTTLLNALACRLDSNFKVEGTKLLNGVPYTNSDLKKFAGYVMQDDLLNAYLTAGETLGYTAALRLPNLTKAQQEERVLTSLQDMGLMHSKDVVVGHPMAKLRGLSGGERKRLCVSVELLLGPILMFLDEPTTGLDSTAALDLIIKLQALARNRCTVVASIHQPQSKIFNMFQSIVLVQSGYVVFNGSLSSALMTCEKLGVPVPPLTNPSDHLMDLLSPKGGFSEDKMIFKPISPDQFDYQLGSDIPLEVNRGRVPWKDQLQILCRKNVKEQRRKVSVLMVALIQNVALAILIGGVFLHIGKSQKSVTRRQPVLFFCCVNQGITGAMVVLNSFPSERALSLRERAAGTYYASAYFLSKSLVDSVIQVITPIVFSCIVYPIVGLDNDVNKFFVFAAFMVLLNICATSMALMISALCRTTDLSMAVLPMVLEVGRLFGGFFLSPANLPKYFVWLDALSFYKYAYVGISLNELHGLELTCTEKERTASGQCNVPDGQYTIDLLGLDAFTITECALVLVAFIFLARLIAFLAVKYLKN